MVLQVLAGFAVFIGLLFAYFMLRLLWRKSWFFACLRGLTGLFLLACSLAFLAAAWDIWGYRQALVETPIATLSFEQLDDQLYRVNLTEKNGVEQTFDLHGDQWQLDAKIIKPLGPLSKWGIKPAYRLERLSGRYFTLDDERNAPRSIFFLGPSVPPSLDIWHLLTRSATSRWVDAVYGNAAYVPMEDGALYDVTLTYSGLIARPLNAQAKQAVKRWE